jgi:hypothetical protein
MALTQDDVNQLMRDAVNGKTEPSIAGAEAATYFKELKAEVDEMLKNGIMPMPARD